MGTNAPIFHLYTLEPRFLKSLRLCYDSPRILTNLFSQQFGFQNNPVGVKRCRPKRQIIVETGAG